MAFDLEGLIFRCLDRYMAGRYSKRYMIATSWDADKHMVKGLLQPEGIESGWIPVHTVSAGNGYGLMTGIMAGEHLEITHQEGEFEAGAVTARIHSKKQPPPKLESGEFLLRTPFDSFVKMDKQGAVTIQDKSGKAKIFMDGSGNITINAKAFTLTATGKVEIDGDPVDVNQ